MSDEITSYSNAPARITCGGRDFALHPLTIGDRVEIAARLRSDRMNAFLKEIETKPLPPEIIGNALAQIASSEVDQSDMTLTPAGQVYVIYHSLRRGDKSITLDAVKRLPPMTYSTLLQVIAAANLIEGGKDDEADPTTAEPDTTSTSGS